MSILTIANVAQIIDNTAYSRGSLCNADIATWLLENRVDVQIAAEQFAAGQITRDEFTVVIYHAINAGIGSPQVAAAYIPLT